jgi:endoglucanase
MKASERRILRAILDSPTAPFSEHRVQARIEALAREMGCSVQRDRWGNTYVWYRQGRARPLALSAHMDHPGFEVVTGGRRARARLLGGVLAETLRGAPVVFHAPVQQPLQRPLEAFAPGIRGRIRTVHSRPVRGARRPEITVELDLEDAIGHDHFGHFDFAGVDMRGNHLHSKAHDNLMSCVLILATMDRLRRRHRDANLLGVFTRAEEVGFIGAGGVLRSDILRPSRPLVVLECSKAFGAVQLGGGPVLRVGDRMTCFDPWMDLWLSQAAAAVQKRKAAFHFQRALMTGGACEASLFQLHGRQVGALAMPLLNYHNMTHDGRIGPEIVDLRDFDNALLLLEHLAQNPPTAASRQTARRSLDDIFRKSSRRLLRSR